MFPFATSFGVLFIVLLTSFGADGNAAVRTFLLNAGVECPDIANYPRSHCQLATNCSTYAAYLELQTLTPDQIPGCGFLNAGHSYMICCPDYLPEGKPTTEATATEEDEDFIQKLDPSGLTVNHLASLGYFKPSTMDEIIYRCTAIIVSPTKVLATTKCVGSKVTEKPNRVLVGVSDPRNYFDPNQEIEIKQPPKIFNDLVLFELNDPIDKQMLCRGNVSIATLCNKEELEGTPTMHAVGFSQYDERNCDLFTSTQMNKGNCSNVVFDLEVDGFHKTRSHLCLKPRCCSISLRSESCSECLTASTSVLHVRRSDGSYCVAAIATPTTNKCVESEQPVYYTSLVTHAAKKFLELPRATYRST